MTPPSTVEPRRPAGPAEPGPGPGPEAGTSLAGRLRALLADRRVRLLLAAAAALRVVVGLDLWRHDPLTRALLSDAAYYDGWARALAAGEPFRAGLPHWLPPLYPQALGVLYRLTGGAPGWTLLAQGALGLAATLLVVAVASRVVSRGAAIAAGWLWTLYAPVVFFENRLLAVNAAVLLSLLALWHALAAEARLRAGADAARAALRPALACGLFCGVAAMARPNLLLGAPFVALAWLVAPIAGDTRERHGARARTLAAGAVLALGALVGVSPSLVHNWRASGAPLLVTANGGVNFWFGNNPAAHGTFHAPGPEWGAIDRQREVSLALASEAEGRELGDAEASAWWFDRGRRWLGEHPRDALALYGLKLADTLSSTELGIQAVPAASRRSARSLWLPFLPFGALLLLAALGWRTGPGEPRGRAPTAALVGWLAAGLVASLLYFTYSRFRLPVLPALLPFAGRGAVRLAASWRGAAGRRWSGPALVAGLALLVLSFVPFEGDYPSRLVSNALVDTALAAGARGDPAAQRERLDEALAAWPESPKALTELGLLAQAGGDEAGAVRAYERVLAGGLDYPEARRALCALLLGAADPALRDRARGLALLRAWREPRSPAHPYWAPMTTLLAAGLADSGEPAELREAEELAGAVLERDPEDRAARLLLETLRSR